MAVIKTKTLREITLENPQATRALERLNIDYWCRGHLSLTDACEAAGVDVQAAALELERSAIADIDGGLPQQKSASDLIDHIVKKHHVFARNEAFRLAVLMEAVCSEDGQRNPELRDLQLRFLTLCNDLFSHLKKEETDLFPFIRSMDEALGQGRPLKAPAFISVRNPERMLAWEHDETNNILNKMRSITAEYTLPDGAGQGIRELYSGLEALEKDLRQHIHLENNVLFPLAAEIEEQARAAGLLS
ncbi:MAG: DUF542 domain-containing protein [Acidobacteria bacterium]|nr:DUF542 domain-containing protein [Acidobacteriota bacterium]